MTYWAEKTKSAWYVEGNNNLALTLRNLERDDGYTLDDFRLRGVVCDGYRYKLKDFRETSEGAVLYKFKGERIDMPRCDIYPPPRKTIPKSVREKVKAMFGGRCAYCGAELGHHFAIDHLNPISMFSVMADDESNFVPSCVPCNHFKAAMYLDEFRKAIAHTYETIQRASAAGRIAARFGLLKSIDNPTFFFETIGFSSRTKDGIFFEIVNDKTGDVISGMTKDVFETRLKKEREMENGRI